MKTNEQFEALLESVKSGAHGHAYLFCGVSSIDKKEAALAFARALTGGAEGKHDPDILLLGGESEEDFVSLSKVREIGRFISFEPYGGYNKAVIIDAFHKLKPEAASALLKILEEPPARSVFILISDHPAAILPTVLSRVQKMNFADGGIRKSIDEKDELLYALEEVLTADAAGRLMLVERLLEENDDAAVIMERWISLLYDMTHYALGVSETTMRSPGLKGEFQKILAQTGLAAPVLAEKIQMITENLHAMRVTNASKRLLLERTVLSL